MRRAWKVRLAGLPPVRLAACGRASRISSTSRALLRERLLGPLPDDRLDDPPGVLLLAVRAQDAHQFAGRVGVEHVGGARARRLVHPHVERGVLRVGEAAVGLVELHGGDAEVEQDALDARDAEPVEHLGQLVVDRVHQRGAVGVGGEPLAGESQRLRVAVEADQPAVGEAWRAAPRCGRRGRGCSRRRRRRARPGRGPAGPGSAGASPDVAYACRGLVVAARAPSQVRRGMRCARAPGPRPLEGEAAAGAGEVTPATGSGRRPSRTYAPRTRGAGIRRGASRLPLRVTLVHSSPRSTNWPGASRTAAPRMRRNGGVHPCGCDRAHACGVPHNDARRRSLPASRRAAPAA